MKKLTIKSIQHFKNLFWVSFRLNDASAVLISEMVKKFDRGYPRKEGLLSEKSPISPAKQLKGIRMALQKDLSRPDDNVNRPGFIGDFVT